jgi:hypothetical protein
MHSSVLVAQTQPFVGLHFRAQNFVNKVGQCSETPTSVREQV